MPIRSLFATPLYEAELGDENLLEELAHSIRVLAVSHIDPLADRAFFKAIKAATARAPGVYVHIPDGIIEFLVDTARGQQRFELWNAKELRAGGRD